MEEELGIEPIDTTAQESQEIKELNDWLADYREGGYGKSAVFRSNDLGGHMELGRSKCNSGHSIGPSQEKVHEILKSYGKTLGIEYVVR